MLPGSGRKLEADWFPVFLCQTPCGGTSSKEVKPGGEKRAAGLVLSSMRRRSVGLISPVTGWPLVNLCRSLQAPHMVSELWDRRWLPLLEHWYMPVCPLAEAPEASVLLGPRRSWSLDESLAEESAEHGSSRVWSLLLLSPRSPPSSLHICLGGRELFGVLALKSCSGTGGSGRWVV